MNQYQKWTYGTISIVGGLCLIPIVIFFYVSSQGFIPYWSTIIIMIGIPVGLFLIMIPLIRSAFKRHQEWGDIEK